MKIALKCISIIALACMFLTMGCGKRKKKVISEEKKGVNITFKSDPATSGTCNITNEFFNKMDVIMEIGTLDGNNNIVWDDTKKQRYPGNQFLTCCAYNFGIPESGSYVVKFTAVHIDCLPCCRSNCNNNNGKPLYQKEIIMPAWTNGQNVEVALRFITCICC